MEEFKIITLILLTTVIIDAVGDAFRTRKWQILHHILEVTGIIAWFSLLFVAKEVSVFYPIMYVLGRIAVFDPIYNFASGMPLKYVGNSSLYDRFLRKFTFWVKEPGFLLWVIRALCLYWWLTWFFTNAGGRI